MTDQTATSQQTDSESTPPPTDASVAAAEEVGFDYVDLMLDGDLKSQVNYAFVKAIAVALDEKVRLLVDAEAKITAGEGEESFAEMALPEIEAMAQAVTGGGGAH